MAGDDKAPAAPRVLRMGRRELMLVAAALVTPLDARAQSRLPVVGFLRSTGAAPFKHLADAFGDGLKEGGFVEGETVSIQRRYADGHPDRLPELAADLIRSGAAVIVGNSLAAEAAKRLTATIPIVFVTSDDPVKRGLVASLARPGGNATGFTFFGGGQLTAKRIEILRDLVPEAETIGLLIDPGWPPSAIDRDEADMAAHKLARRLVIGSAARPPELAPAFAAFSQAGVGALVVAGAPFFSSQRPALIELSAQHFLPTIYDLREFVVEGGLVSYSGSFTDAYRQAGIYAAKILRGDNPAVLPVQQPTKFELVINLNTAKSLGLAVPPAVLARADEVIE